MTQTRDANVMGGKSNGMFQSFRIGNLAVGIAKFGRWRSGGLVVGCLCAGFAAPAYASFQVCNQTFDVINVAIGQWDFDAWESSGWWTVGPNQCANVIEPDLTSRFIYVYARDVFNKSMLAGTTQMCVAPEEFRVRGREDCLVRGYLSAPFFEVDTRLSERWTFYVQTR